MATANITAVSIYTYISYASGGYDGDWGSSAFYPVSYGSSTRFPYLKFDVSAVIRKKINSVTLQMYQTGTGNGSGGSPASDVVLAIYGHKSSQPTGQWFYQGSSYGSAYYFTCPRSNTFMGWDTKLLTGFNFNQHQDGLIFLSMSITGTSYAGVTFTGYSTSTPPTLAIDYSDLPAGAPTNLMPSGTSHNPSNPITFIWTHAANSELLAEDPETGSEFRYRFKTATGTFGEWTTITLSNASNQYTLPANTAMVYGTLEYQVRVITQYNGWSAWSSSSIQLLGSPPSDPGSFTIPTPIMGGSVINVSWGVSTDPDGNLSGYKLEKSTDNGITWTLINQGPISSYNDAITFGTTSVKYRVKAYDSVGLESGYTTSSTVSVTNNHPPTIALVQSSNLGVQTGAFSFDFSVDDQDPGDSITVIVQSQGRVIMTIPNAVRGQNYTVNISYNDFLQSPGGLNEILISADDGQDTVSIPVTWERNVMQIDVIVGPVGGLLSVMPTLISINPVYDKPSDATITALVTNNCYDASPVWENASSSVINKHGYNFSNTSKTDANWGVKIRFTLTRGVLPGRLELRDIGVSLK